ncbi:Uu.00g093330.m01.CDS01 [Anthostomella pinea]|uniref:Uu.00g093330.m01.CDS01 n=1 Tax=Anthostomella pinea TaxID=933095 RepID=A0AAI8YKK4_9PEZI|nr:Uu.00g093330.m01.CDS01 [Anthostomella pinea]
MAQSHATRLLLCLFITICVGVPFQPRRSTQLEQICAKTHVGITPWNAPLLTWDKKAKRSPRDYLEPAKKPYGKAVARWQRKFFEQSDIDSSDGESKPEIDPIRTGAPTLITMIYENPLKESTMREYLRRFELLVNIHEQIIVYTSEKLADVIKKMRKEDQDHFIVITKFDSVWDIPNNKGQKENFENIQPKLYKEFDGFGAFNPLGRIMDMYQSAIYNAKVAVIFDAITQNNKFGSDKWLWADCGLIIVKAEKAAPGTAWGEVLSHFFDDDKFERSIRLTGNSGVVVQEYGAGDRPRGADIDSITSDGWTTPRREWKTFRYLAMVWAGSSLGMLEWAVKFMQTFDEMDANGFYVAREEVVMSYTALRYPNTVFSIPYYETNTPLQLGFPGRSYPARTAWSAYGGRATAPPINDPLSTVYCPGGVYQPQRPNLRMGEW